MKMVHHIVSQMHQIVSHQDASHCPMYLKSVFVLRKLFKKIKLSIEYHENEI